MTPDTPNPSEIVAILRKIALRLLISGEYGPDFSEVADSTGIGHGADLIEKLRRDLYLLRDERDNGLDNIDRLKQDLAAANARIAELEKQHGN